MPIPDPADHCPVNWLEPTADAGFDSAAEVAGGVVPLRGTTPSSEDECVQTAVNLEYEGTSFINFRDYDFPPARKTGEQILAEHLRDAVAKIRPDDETRALLSELEHRLGCPLLAIDAELDADDIGAVLIPGTRVCFTGTAIDDAGSTWARSDLEALAEKCGLEPVQTVIKTKCEALIAAEGRDAIQERQTSRPLRKTDLHRPSIPRLGRQPVILPIAFYGAVETSIGSTTTSDDAVDFEHAFGGMGNRSAGHDGAARGGHRPA